LDFWRSDGVQGKVHLKMDGAEVRKKSAMKGDRGTSHEPTDTFSYTDLNEEVALYLAFSPDGGRYALAAMPAGVRKAQRVSKEVKICRGIFPCTVGSAPESRKETIAALGRCSNSTRRRKGRRKRSCARRVKYCRP
jgi:hypothetical protein